MKQLKKVWQFSLPELLQSLGLIAGCGLFAILLVFVIVSVAKSDDYALLAGFFAFLVWVLMELWGGMMHFGKTFAMMVSMSRTRKEFFGAYVLSNLFNNCIKMAVTVGIVLLEKAMIGYYCKGLVCELDLSGFILDYRVIVATILLSLGIRMLFGVLYLKYQMVIFWILWGLTMCSGLLINLFAKALHNPSVNKVAGFVIGLAEKFVAAGGLVQIVIIGVIFGVMTAIAGILTGKQAVKC